MGKVLTVGKAVRYLKRFVVPFHFAEKEGSIWRIRVRFKQHDILLMTRGEVRSLNDPIIFVKVRRKNALPSDTGTYFVHLPSAVDYILKSDLQNNWLRQPGGGAA